MYTWLTDIDAQIGERKIDGWIHRSEPDKDNFHQGSGCEDKDGFLSVYLPGKSVVTGSMRRLTE